MGQGQPGPIGPIGVPGKDATVDYNILQKNVVTNDDFRNQIKTALLTDPEFKNVISNYMKDNNALFRGDKGVSEFKALTTDEQTFVIGTLVTNHIDIFVARLSKNQDFQTAVVNTMKTISEFRGPPGANGKDGVNGKDGANGIDGKSFDSAELKKNVMWCADGDLCSVPKGKKGLDWGYGASKIYDDGQLKLETDDNLFLKINNNNTVQVTQNDILLDKGTSLQFGNGYTRQADAGKIVYGRFDGGETLNIVGGGKDNQIRQVRLWDRLVVNTDTSGLQEQTRLKVGGNIWADNGAVYANSLYLKDGNSWLSIDANTVKNLVTRDKKYALASTGAGKTKYLTSWGTDRDNVDGEFGKFKFVLQ